MLPTSWLNRLRVLGVLLAIELITGCPGPMGPVGNGSADDGNGGSDVSSKVYHVSSRGDDDADGLSQATSFRTIARAADVVRPGDVVAIQPGTYSEAVRLENRGSTQATITIRGEGGRPVFDGERELSVGMWCSECTNFIFENLEFRGYADIGIAATSSTNVTFRNLVAHDNGFAATIEWAEGYGLFADDSSQMVIEDCEVFHNGPDPQVPERWLGTGIDTFNITDSVISNNRSYGNTGGGILVEDSANVLVEGNEITGNNLDATVEEWWDGGIWIDGGHDITLRGNTIRDNIGPGVEISDENNQQPTGYALEGNTITGNLYGLYVWNFGTSDLPPSNILELTDNDISGNTTRDLWIVEWECPPDDPCE